jgi:hypothetical protein
MKTRDKHHLFVLNMYILCVSRVGFYQNSNLKYTRNYTQMQNQTVFVLEQYSKRHPSTNFNKTPSANHILL